MSLQLFLLCSHRGWKRNLSLMSLACHNKRIGYGPCRVPSMGVLIYLMGVQVIVVVVVAVIEVMARILVALQVVHTVGIDEVA